MFSYALRSNGPGRRDPQRTRSPEDYECLGGRRRGGEGKGRTSFALSRSVTLRYVTFHYVTFCYVTLHYITFCYVTLHYVRFCCVTLRSVTLRYVTLRSFRTAIPAPPVPPRCFSAQASASTPNTGAVQPRVSSPPSSSPSARRPPLRDPFVPPPQAYFFLDRQSVPGSSDVLVRAPAANPQALPRFVLDSVGGSEAAAAERKRRRREAAAEKKERLAAIAAAAPKPERNRAAAAASKASRAEGEVSVARSVDAAGLVARAAAPWPLRGRRLRAARLASRSCAKEVVWFFPAIRLLSSQSNLMDKQGWQILS